MIFKKVQITAEKVEVIMRYFFILLTIIAIVIGFWDIEDNPMEWEQISAMFLTLILFLLPSFFSKNTRLNIPPTFEIILLLFIFASMYLGEIRGFFYKYTWWDTMLHSSSAMILAYIGFLLIFTLNKDQHIHLKLSPFFIALFTFCFAMMIGAIWEIFEYLVDEYMGINMQKARYLTAPDGTVHSRLGIEDTMQDLIVNTYGALIVAVIGYYYSKTKMKKDSAFWKLTDKFFEENPDLFKK